MTHYAIVVAGGRGNRMGNELPKQFLPLAGKPLLMHSLLAFSQSRFKPEIILVLHPDERERWADLCQTYKCTISHHIASAGTERYHSVKNALTLVETGGMVAVHDAARPLISTDLIDRCYERTLRHGNAVAALPATDSIRLQENGVSQAIDRNKVFIIQTPQTFYSSELLDAYNQPFQPLFTDDASVMQAAGSEIYLEPGERRNFKITYPTDLVFAEALIADKT
ncbi:2-C-methyl-D-erythritol 4-phosphate cytidylyltransferase [Pedobacter sp. SYP-B3415]|uniref:2-C-methyl-D-erythritol 4-phosphate cytidylyltransferase n=1 Tax=Pedobacter sp. SYP-B3415 TaxID=2496641 RepID=UPI00101B9A22|nr:2-C-methyl-D-erythritol 4-phosphate cytidylyltransferase [Pedobacter sp. SYP-B3415]